MAPNSPVLVLLSVVYFPKSRSIGEEIPSGTRYQITIFQDSSGSDMLLRWSANLPAQRPQTQPSFRLCRTSQKMRTCFLYSKNWVRSQICSTTASAQSWLRKFNPTPRPAYPSFTTPPCTFASFSTFHRWFGSNRYSRKASRYSLCVTFAGSAMSNKTLILGNDWQRPVRCLGLGWDSASGGYMEGVNTRVWERLVTSRDSYDMWAVLTGYGWTCEWIAQVLWCTCIS